MVCYDGHSEYALFYHMDIPHHHQRFRLLYTLSPSVMLLEIHHFGFDVIHGTQNSVPAIVYSCYDSLQLGVYLYNPNHDTSWS